MEGELFQNLYSEEDTVEADANDEGILYDGERCGICMDIIIDRGLLDCCHHWFCFVCIDNWSTITNLCPLCQNEFHLITCVPVYNTIGSNKHHEDVSRDDDWSVEGNNKTLSFPSYYIDENAVTCLDGDGCKTRSNMSLDDNLTLDTSIACDSCDIWYHAACVGFDTEGPSVDSWLCPRCLDAAQQKSGISLVDGVSKLDDFSKVLVTVADAGETAIVVSTINGKQVAEDSTQGDLSSPKLNKNDVPDQSVFLGAIPSESGTSGDNHIDVLLLKEENDDLHVSTQDDTHLNLTEDFHEAKPSPEALMITTPRSADDFELHDAENHTVDIKNMSMNGETDSAKSDFMMDGGEPLTPSARDLAVAADEKTDSSSLSGRKKEVFEHSDEKQLRPTAGASKKKGKVGEGSPMTVLEVQTEKYASNEKDCRNGESSSDQHIRLEVEEKTSACDIMSIVRDVGPTKINAHVGKHPADKSLIDKKDAARMRMKKIMRRPADDAESSILVQKLREDIRGAVRNKSSDDIGKSIFDPKLLAAFRAAVAPPVTEQTKKPSPAVLKAKKLLLRKGNKRENLTKKIYSTNNGKRRRAWDRDCEVEFWKHRCLETTKPEKVETLKSVLGLLRKDHESIRMEADSEGHANNPILSRLYLADASVFPRKNDIKPLADLKGSGSLDGMSGDGKCGPTMVEMKVESSFDTDISKMLNSGKSATDFPFNNHKKNGPTDMKLGVPSCKKLLSGQKSKSSDDSNADSLKKINESVDIKTDKRKWALQFLARKTASESKSSMHENQQKNAMLKGSPLLAQLPLDMNPKLASTRHNKIPVAVRQTQLNRLAEQLLRMTNLPTMHRTAATELAIADAINIEKAVAERSSSKPVYLNLCAQEIRRYASSRDSSSIVSESTDPTQSGKPAEEEELSPPARSISSEAEAVLRAAGLLSDSPPSSPFQEDETQNEGANSPMEDNEEGPDNLLEVGPNAELDIYGDFEYDLDDDDYIGASTIKVSKLQAEEGETKMKLVFSTLGTDKSNKNIDVGGNERAESEIPSSSAKLPSVESNGNEVPVAEVSDAPCLARESDGHGAEEPTVEECEELYGPDKGLPVTSFPEMLSTEKTPPLQISDHSSGQALNPSEVESKRGLDKHSNSKSRPVLAGEGNPVNCDHASDQHFGKTNSVAGKVQAYIKEHIRPLCKSGIISGEQYRWAVAKTTGKVMKHHYKAKNADFLIKEGEKVKKLAEQYVETAKMKEK